MHIGKKKDRVRLEKPKPLQEQAGVQVAHAHEETVVGAAKGKEPPAPKYTAPPRETRRPGTSAAVGGLSFGERAFSAAKKSVGVALLGLALFAMPTRASAQDMTGVQLSPVMTRLQQTTSTMQSPAPVDAAFKFAALPEGAKLPVDGVFKTKKLLKTWTLEFTGDAQVVKSNARELTLHVTAIVSEGFLEGKSRVIELSWKQDGDSPQVRFLGRELTKDVKDKEEDVGSLLIVTGVEDGGTQMMRVRDDRKAPTAKRDGVLITDDGGTLTIRYDQNVIRVKRPAPTPGD